ncbi:MAG: DEAD/DEAH box helicase [Candidatus Poseidoniaceae archaeon]
MFTNQRFDNWSLKPSTISGLEKLGWEKATPVQRDTIPTALQGNDVIGQARTGSGKTGAFSIPIIEACSPTGNLQALVLAPTRELANQVSEEMNSIQGDNGLKIITVYGGTDLEKQARQLTDGVDIIVGTPGRVMDMTKREYIDMSAPTIFCLDEADRMLDMGFFPDITWVIERMTARSQTLLFSATFPQEILDAAYEFMDEPEFVLTNTEELDIPPIKMYSVNVGRANKLWALSRLLSNTTDDDQIIVFCNTKRMVDLSVQKLTKAGTQVSGLHGDLSQNQRERILDSFKSGDTKTIIATDVAARGIDVDGITLVVNYDVPDDMDSFIHRIGRTGRIGREGQAWSLVSKNDTGQLSRIIATYGLDIEQIGVPNLPTGVDKDIIAYKDDFMESADVFGFVPIRLTLDEQIDLSSRVIANWLAEKMRCDELAIGDIQFEPDAIVVNIHSSKVSLALKALEKYELNGTKVSAEV